LIKIYSSQRISKPTPRGVSVREYPRLPLCRAVLCIERAWKARAQRLVRPAHGRGHGHPSLPHKEQGGLPEQDEEGRRRRNFQGASIDTSAYCMYVCVYASDIHTILYAVGTTNSRSFVNCTVCMDMRKFSADIVSLPIRDILFYL